MIFQIFFDRRFLEELVVLTMAIFQRGSTRDKIFRQALSRESHRSKKVLPRDEESASVFPYGIFSLWIFFFGTVAYVACFSPVLMVTEVTITGSDRVSEQRMRDTVETIVGQAYWNIFSKRNYFFVPKGELRETLIESYPLLSSVTIETIFPRRIQITVVEHPFLLLWCSGGPCYQLDDKDRAVVNDRFFYTVYDPWRLLVTDTSALPVTAGELLPVRKYTELFTSLYQMFPDSVGVMLLPEAFTPSRYAEELRIRTSDGWQLFVSLEIPPKEIATSVKAFLERRKASQLAGSFSLPLATIDMRVPGKLFFSELKDDMESPLQEELLIQNSEQSIKIEATSKKRSKR